MSYPYPAGTTFVQPIARRPIDEFYENEESLKRFGKHPMNESIRAELIARQAELRAQLKIAD